MSRRMEAEAPPSSDVEAAPAPPPESPAGSVVESSGPPPAGAPAEVQWYHAPPGTWRELRVGVGGGVIVPAVATGLLISALIAALFGVFGGMAAGAAGMMGTITERPSLEVRAGFVRDLGTLAPPGDKFQVSGLLAADDEGKSARTCYRFMLPREQVDAYRAHLIETWHKEPMHRAVDGRYDPLLTGGGPTWWDGRDTNEHTRVRLELSHGHPVFRAAFDKERGHVYLIVSR